MNRKPLSDVIAVKGQLSKEISMLPKHYCHFEMLKNPLYL